VKQFSGQASNISKTIIGRASKQRKGIFNRKDCVLISDNSADGLWGYAGLITVNTEHKTKKPSIKVSDESIFKEIYDNDIVKLDPNGDITVIWEDSSPHNSILLTERCNCRCITCPQPPTSSDDKIQFVNNYKLLSLIDPKTTLQIGLTGGEPTLVGDHLFKIIALCRDKLPNTTLNLLSNGRQFNKFEFAKQFAEINHPRLIICVSLGSDTDTINDKIMGAKGSFFETMTGLHNLALFRQKVEIRVVIHQMNYERLPQLADFIYRNCPFVIHIAFMGMEITGLCLDNITELWIDPIEYSKSLRTAVLQLNRQLMNVSIYNLPRCLLHEDLRSFARQSISTWKNIYLPICEGCFEKEECCGVFSTSGKWQSKNIRPIAFHVD
jgi:His-Xaa-Ser system radical SAM maturase HxsC